MIMNALSGQCYPQFSFWREKKNRERVSHYRKHRNHFNFKGTDLNMKIKSIPKFEKQNDISINVFILDEESFDYDFEPTIVPVHLTANEKKAC